MIIDIDRILIGFTGQEVRNEGKPVSLKEVCITALAGDLPDSHKTESVADRMNRINLANRIYMSTGKIEVTVEEAALIKSKIPHFFASPVMWAAFKLIEV